MSRTIDLKSLATKASEKLERNKVRNINGTNNEILVPQLMGDGTTFHVDICDLREAFEERLAICEYDGALYLEAAERTALLDLYASLLWSLRTPTKKDQE